MQTYTVKIDEDGTTRWYNEANQLHRENDLPAAEYADGSKFYYLNGKLHRENGPDVELADGSKFYYLNGSLHREDGPAMEYANGTKAYYLNGKKLSEEQFNNRNRPLIGTKTIINGLEYTLS